MSEQQLTAIGTALLRVTLGVVLIAHSVYLKAVVYGLPGTAAFFASIGLPQTLAYAVFAIEAAAGIALVIGYQARWAAAVTVPILIGATWAHWSAGWLFSNTGGGWEYPAVLCALASAQALLGRGSFSFAARPSEDQAAADVESSQLAA